jgi:hypothetical protein
LNVNTALARELLEMLALDTSVRSDLAADGSLYGGYHPRMREVHDRNAGRLRDIWDQFGWPGKSMVGAEASHAAWVILQHAIAQPEFQRAGLLALQRLADAGEVDAVEVAMLDDRICSFEGRPQPFGTQFDWDADGVMSPLPHEDEVLVNARRAAFGMPTLAEGTAMRRAAAALGNEKPPADWNAYQAERLEWLKRTGWRPWE